MIPRSIRPIERCAVPAVRVPQAELHASWGDSVDFSEIPLPGRVVDFAISDLDAIWFLEIQVVLS
jgi:hypothetical protein